MPVDEWVLQYTGAIWCLSSVDRDGKPGCGTAFHVGGGVLVTARHVVEERLELRLTTDARRLEQVSIEGEVLYHPDPRVDVAVVRADVAGSDYIPLGGHLDDWIGLRDFLLWEVVVLGFPPIPMSKEIALVATRGELNGIVDLYHTPHPHFVLSTMARGGFSGAPVIHDGMGLMGMVTSSLVSDGSVAETGFQVAVSVEPILVCLGHHRVAPDEVRSDWDEHGGRWSLFERSDEP